MTKKLKKTKEPEIQVPTAWTDLNEILIQSDLETSTKLLEAERAGRRRKQFMLRIHSRINKLRAADEREKLIKEAA